MREFFFKYWKVIVSGFLLTVIIIIFVLPPVLQAVIEKKIVEAVARTEKKIGRPITIRSLRFMNTASIALEKVSIGSDSVTSARLVAAGFSLPGPLVEIRNIQVDIYLGGIFTGQFVQSIMIDSVSAQLVKTSDSTNNYISLINAFQTSSLNVPGSSQPVEKNKIARFIDTYLEKKLPSLDIRHLDLTYRDYSALRLSNRKTGKKPAELKLDNFSMKLRESLLRDAQFELRGMVLQDAAKNHVEINGTLNHSKRRLILNALFDSHFKIPFLSSVFDGNLSLRSFDAEIFSIEGDDIRSNVKASLNISDMEIESEVIADKKLRDVNLGFDLDLNIGPDDVIIHPETKAYLNKITGFIEGKIDRLHGEPLFDLKFKLPMIAMDDFFSSVPSALMTRLEGIKVKGSFEFEAALNLDFTQLDSVKYRPTLRLSEDFKVLSLGDSIEVKMLRDSFDYTFEREDKTDSSFLVGISNPYYYPLDSVPPILINSVLFCEDNSFFKNDGFNVLQIGRSLRDNIRAKHFARGASTISMQFTKNIYLSREKTIARKFQELILTWLFNHEKFLDEKHDKEKHKRRLLEIYLNIIEWGPDVHGVGRATEFYFHKKPKDLTVGESVFLATIIPNPKKYDRYFEDGEPKKKHMNFMNLIVKMLHEKDVIDSLTMVQNLPCTFRITGEARRFMAGIKAADSTDTEQEIYYKDLELTH